MDLILSRFRSLAFLVVVILAQLILLAYQKQSKNDMPMIRVWAVTAVTPLARVLESVRSNTFGFVKNYFVLVDLREENKRIKEDLGRFKLENQFLKNELSTADRVQALSRFQSRIPSRTVAARVIGTGTGTNSKMVFVDRGTSNGVERGMAVITQDGIVGKVVASYPISAQVLLATDSSFAAGVISQKNRVHGTLKGTGQSRVLIDYIQNEDKVEVGEEFFTSGEDRIFPKGLPVGKAEIVKPGKTFKDIQFVPSQLQAGLEEVLIVIEGVHQAIPDSLQGVQAPIHIQSPVPPELNDKMQQEDRSETGLATDADRIRDRYKRVGEAQGYTYGSGYRLPNFNLEPPALKPIQPTGKPDDAAAAPPNSQNKVPQKQ